MLDESKSDLHTAATPALDEITSYAELEALRQSAAQKLEDVYEAAQRELTNLLASARNADAWDGETVTQPEQKDGVYQIGTPAELAARKELNDNTVSASAKAVLTADIDPRLLRVDAHRTDERPRPIAAASTDRATPFPACTSARQAPAMPA